MCKRCCVPCQHFGQLRFHSSVSELQPCAAVVRTCRTPSSPWRVVALLATGKMGCETSKEQQVQDPDQGPADPAAPVEKPKGDKLKFRQPTVIDLLGDERAELDAKLLRWATKIFDEIDADGKGYLTGPDLAAALKKLPPSKAPKLAPVCPCCLVHARGSRHALSVPPHHRRVCWPCDAGRSAARVSAFSHCLLRHSRADSGLLGTLGARLEDSGRIHRHLGREWRRPSEQGGMVGEFTEMRWARAHYCRSPR